MPVAAWTESAGGWGWSFLAGWLAVLMRLSLTRNKSLVRWQQARGMDRVLLQPAEQMSCC